MTTSTEESKVTQESKVIRAHELQDKVFLMPTWCDMCAGILVGRGYQCKGPCRQRCHLGLGDHGAENCRADLLLKPCNHGVKHEVGKYKFGAITKQLARDAHQTVKDVVVQEAVKEQRELGKFTKLKEQVQGLRAQWSDSKALMCTLLLQIASVSFMVLLSCILPVMGLGRLGSSVQLGHLLASWSVAVLLFHHVLVLVLVHVAAASMLRYSALVHSFVDNILHIDLGELEINLDHTAVAVQRVADRAIIITLALLVASLGVWLKAVWTVAGK